MPTNRDNSFIPLSSAALPPNERPNFRVTVLSQAANAQPFHELGQSGSPAALPQSPGHEPQVTLQREGDRVSAIHVHCACGRVAELECVYEPAPSAPPFPPGAEPLVASPPQSIPAQPRGN